MIGAIIQLVTRAGYFMVNPGGNGDVEIAADLHICDRALSERRFIQNGLGAGIDIFDQVIDARQA